LYLCPWSSTSIAVRTIVNGTQNTLNWLLSDHLGSASITTTADGTWFSELRYSAFGETRYSSGITATDYRYTGQLEQADINLYYYNARYYDPALGRFVQSDTIVPEPGSSIGYNRYTYVRNNPIRYTDPSGHLVNTCNDFDPYCGVDGGARANAYATNKAKNAKPALPSSINKYKQTSKYHNYNYSQTNQSPSSQSIMSNSSSDSTSSTLPLIPPSYPQNSTNYHVFPPNGYYVSGYETYIEPAKLDYWDLGVDVAGLTADGLLLLSGFFALVYPPAAAATFKLSGIVQQVEWIGVGKSVVDFVFENNLSGLGSIVAENELEKYFETKGLKFIPLVGIVSSGLSLQNNFDNATEVRSILSPLPIISEP